MSAFDKSYGRRFREDTNNLRERKPELARQIESLRWVADGLQRKEEYWAARGLIKLADMGHLAKFIKEPWVVEGRNYAALWNLATSNVSFDPPEVLSWVADHPALDDGISDREAKILATVAVPDDASNLDPDAVTVEDRTITLPLAGTVELTIIWTSRGLDATMDMLEQSVRRIEGAMGLPFPQRQVVYRIDLDGPWYGGYKTGWFVHLSGPWSPELLRITVPHETAHYYWDWPNAGWTGSQVNYQWVHEGAAEFLSHLDEDITLDVEPGSECDLNIPEVERLPPDGPRCWYDIGHRFYRDLHRTMDEGNFRLAFRRWYLHTLHSVPVCSGNPTTYCRVMEAFTTYASEENRAAVEELINRWYGMTP